MDDGALEILTFNQFMHEQRNPGTVQGTPVRTMPIVPKHEPVPGLELLKQRIRISFDFDVIVNNKPLRNASDNAEAIMHDLALLKRFLIADQARLLAMLAAEAGLELGLSSCETFVKTFLPQLNHDKFERWLLEPTIDQLEGASGEYWRKVRDEQPDTKYGDWLSLCTETLFECFKAEFVSSSYEIIEGKEHVS